MTLTSNKTSGLGVFALAMLIISAIDSIRNLPATALFGSALVFFAIFSAIVFLIPAALVSAELAAKDTEKGGIYHWVQQAFGENIGFLAIWLQWINTMVWFPTILSFIAGTATYIVDPALAQNKLYLVSVILSVFWFLTVINLKGINVSAKFVSFCTISGMVIPMTLIIVLACVWLLLGKPLQIHPAASGWLPSLKSSENWISLTAIMTAFLGMELATVHIREVNNAQKVFPKVLIFSAVFILLTMIGGALAIAFVLPAGQINLVDGVMQAFANFFAAYHIAWAIPLLTVMILVGSLGNMVSWIISPAKGLLHAAQMDFLPAFLQKENQHGVASNLLILQAILVSIVCLAFLLMPSVNGSYWLLTDLSTQLYMLMYVLMFLAAICLKYKLQPKAQAFVIPGGKVGMWLISILGLIGCVITLVVGFFPPDGINVGSKVHYEVVFTLGILAMMLPVLFFYFYRWRKTAIEISPRSCTSS